MSLRRKIFCKHSIHSIASISHFFLLLNMFIFYLFTFILPTGFCDVLSPLKSFAFEKIGQTKFVGISLCRNMKPAFHSLLCVGVSARNLVERSPGSDIVHFLKGSARVSAKISL